MSNFILYGRPAVKIRSVAAWNRLRDDYDMMIVNVDGLKAYWPFGEKVGAEYGNYDTLVAETDGLIAQWKLDGKKTVFYASYDVQVLSVPELKAYWKFQEKKDI